MSSHSKKQNLFDAIIVAVICGLLFFSDGIALGLFIIPKFALDIVALGTLALAVALTVTFVVLVMREKPRFALSRALKSPVINAIKKGSETPTSTAPSAIGSWAGQKDEEIKKSVTYSMPKFMSQTVFEPKDVRELRVFPVKRICPGCRKDFVIPSSMADYIVDFGSPKEANFIMDCPHCHTSISLKEAGLQEDIL